MSQCLSDKMAKLGNVEVIINQSFLINAVLLLQTLTLLYYLTSLFVPFCYRIVGVTASPSGCLLQQNLPRSRVLSALAASADHLTGQQSSADAPSSDLLQREVPHFQVSKHGGMQKEPGPDGESSAAQWFQQLVRLG